jgi:hypothetical protein
MCRVNKRLQLANRFRNISMQKTNEIKQSRLDRYELKMCINIFSLSTWFANIQNCKTIKNVTQHLRELGPQPPVYAPVSRQAQTYIVWLQTQYKTNVITTVSKIPIEQNITR